MPGIVKVMTRLRISVVPMPVRKTLTPRRCSPIGGGGHQPEHSARCATGEAVGLQDQGAERSAEQAGEVQQGEPHATERRFEQLAELEQQQHVHPDVEHAVVQEA